MLVELSEILFNELAFFRLMQDLDDPKAKVKARVKEWHRSGAVSPSSIPYKVLSRAEILLSMTSCPNIRYRLFLEQELNETVPIGIRSR